MTLSGAEVVPVKLCGFCVDNDKCDDTTTRKLTTTGGDYRGNIRGQRNLQGGSATSFVFLILNPFGFDDPNVDILDNLRQSVGSGAFANDVIAAAAQSNFAILANTVALEMRISELPGGLSYTYQLW